MKLLFAKKRNLPSALIRFFTWSQWSHVAIVDGDAVIEATFLGGVSWRPLAEFLVDYTTEEVGVSLPDEAAAMRFVRQQIGKRYDWTALVGIVFRSGWAKQDKWFCSELVAAAIQAGGKRLFREDASRITPRDLWLVL